MRLMQASQRSNAWLAFLTMRRIADTAALELSPQFVEPGREPMLPLPGMCPVHHGFNIPPPLGYKLFGRNDTNDAKGPIAAQRQRHQPVGYLARGRGAR